MPTEILAIGTGAANSADQVVTASTPITYCLKDTLGPDLGPNVQVDILLRDDAGQYFQVDSLGARNKAVMIVAAGTYRFSRIATSDS
ncbi:hypothetical protein I6F14_07955 [Bradyrhizobium sp. IC3069]|uniref:hypothetical protein n=1 Tax=Bradyrhizobium TaxID=374 RepID=UPI001CD3AC92|nr:MULTISPECIES: hypothetical protein [unclassified Bradyrhizobium]MCA1361235.1 hypothetical protein [Bradyrhizobium sp. IC4059]MCA1375322.1 hypothetical protein [Bradyrhizobium sp. IC4060]MCA1437715.1 hypothetical protein [Bradyrhizobium sp. BRP20]MCA1485487.1 hypothetical protein [Bradyrhizobium sp. IC4061]MCA1517963.1 hypothetical protein [Bradyrhizobium sp. IC3069]